MKKECPPATNWIVILSLLASICAALTFSLRSFAKANPQADKVGATEAKAILTTTGIVPSDGSVFGYCWFSVVASCWAMPDFGPWRE